MGKLLKMEAIQENNFSEPQRQSSIAIGIILIKFIRTTIRTFWPLLLSFFIGGGAGGDRFESIIGYVALGIAAVNLGGSVLTYFRFYFFIDDDAIVIDKGIIKRTKTNIPFERIQTINFKQNILHQLFNVVSIEIDTAGAKKSEISIDALKKADAIKLRDFILAEKAQITTEATDEPELIDEAQEEQILHLSPMDLLKVGVSQNHLRSMALIFAFVFTTINEGTGDIGDFIASQFSQYESYMVNNALFAFLVSTILVLIISFLFSLVTSFLKYYDLKLTIHKNGLKLIRGLLNREEISINRNKVQIISWSNNPIRKIFSMFTLKISQASSTEVGPKSNIRVPGSYQEQVQCIINNVFPEEKYHFDLKYNVSPLIKFRLFLFIGIIPTLIGLVSYFRIDLDALYFLLILPLSWLLIKLYYSKRTYEVNAEFMKSNGGLFGTRHELTQIHKIQAVRIKQSLYQKRKKLASVLLYTAAGHLELPFVEMEKAQILENFILYRVESDKRQWM